MSSRDSQQDAGSPAGVQGTLVPQAAESAALATTAMQLGDPLSKQSLHPNRQPGRSFPGSGLVLRIWGSRTYRTVAIVAFVGLILALGVASRSLVWNELRNIRQQEFVSLLAADVQALTLWIESRKDHIELAAEDPEIRSAISRLLEKHRELQDGYSAEDIQTELDVFRKRLPEFATTKEEAAQFEAEYNPVVSANSRAAAESPQRLPQVIADEGVYFVGDLQGNVLASTVPEAIGSKLDNRRQPQIAGNLLSGQPGFIPPMRPQQVANLRGLHPEAAIAWIYVPIRNEWGVPQAVLGLGYFSIGNFTRTLVTARTGDTGEAYAIDANGLMLTESRFTESLWTEGILAYGTPSRANLTVQPPRRNSVAQQQEGRPQYTTIVTDALASRGSEGNAGYIMRPYINYRGRYVVGAWQWLDEYNFGVIYETESQEAFRPFTYISITQFVLLTLIAGFGGVAYYAATSLVHARRTIGEHAVVGPYVLLRKIGEGGMGQVFLAQHQMLKRPTAVKLMRPDQTNADLLKRFEREVQLSSRLKHPNTVEIYDYGKTPEGVFYYAMEYLDGLTLESLVQEHGWQSVPRTLFIMRQVAASLREAHAAGLIHRDIKPLNIMLCRVGGEYDVAKVLDFGLVKNLSADAAATSVTSTTEISGTPMYLAPERIKHPTHADARVDIYALGATAFFLLTGRTVFDATSAVDVFVQIVSKPIPTVREAADRIIPDALQELLSRCLAKDPAERPRSAEEVLRTLERLMQQHPWTQEDAGNWWEAKVPPDAMSHLVEEVLAREITAH